MFPNTHLSFCIGILSMSVHFESASGLTAHEYLGYLHRAGTFPHVFGLYELFWIRSGLVLHRMIYDGKGELCL